MKLIIVINNNIIELTLNIVYNSETNYINIDLVLTLKQYGYLSGTYSIKLYFVNDNMFPLTINGLSSNSLLIRISNPSVDSILNINKDIKYLLYNILKSHTNLIVNSIYSQFTKNMILRLQYPLLQLNVTDVVQIRKLLYLPLLMEIYILSKIISILLLFILLTPLFDTKIKNNNIILNISGSYLSLIYDQNKLDTLSFIGYSLLQSVDTFNLDFLDYNNFVQFGSALWLLTTFKEKYAKLYYYNGLINLIIDSGITGSHYILKINLYRQNINDMVKKFTAYDLFLYNKYCLTQSFDSLNKLILQEDIIVYGDILLLLLDAIEYDNENKSSFVHSLPVNIATDLRNLLVLIFMNMIGNMFDLLKLGIHHISLLNKWLLNKLQYLPNEILRYIILSYLIDISQSFSFKKLNLYITNVKKDINGLILTLLNIRNYNKLILLRIVANLPYLLSTKGTKTCILSIFSIFGLSSKIINIYELKRNSDSVGTPV